MRLLIAFSDANQACEIVSALSDLCMEAVYLSSGAKLVQQLHLCDLAVVHHCLPVLDGRTAGDQLAAHPPLCPPRILFIAPPEFSLSRPIWADAVLEHGVSTRGIADTLRVIAKKPLPKLAAAHAQAVGTAVEAFLNALLPDIHLKGRCYLSWLLAQLTLSTLMENWPVNHLYRLCAQAFDTTAPAVERCVRVAVEAVFTQGDLQQIERFFGEAADPERGKLTNRAFMLRSCRWLRYSLTAARSPNKSEMHHSPAAPTRV